ncbi:uncharacterized protein MONBRDRAFT_34620 [Monosiga brevicollis MX1]|uniref:Translation initiation factor eIF2B subunit gamma n=1 Tax=Monosiga brevicollis TaxID=81824 RepID=A9VCX0_MONBE|nr:uncharacterized protein MONBRDRAFT_34620 [Monosiga brevicollis MX1]EDQ84666.1 predicted protein [Monosiga brevicollis MX1]|eukprot:XP_001750570.1 hypothetical protein [Monosiga brevicollis MX1]
MQIAPTARADPFCTHTHTLSHSLTHTRRHAIILAGGPDSRMNPFGGKPGRALLPVCNLPLISYTVGILERAKFDDVIVVAQKAAAPQILTQIKEVLGFKIQLHMHTIENNSDKGTADILRELKDVIKKDFMVLPCDLVTNVPIYQLADIHRKNNASATLLFASFPAKSPDDHVADRKRLQQHEDLKGLTDYVALDAESNRVLLFRSQADLSDSGTVDLRRRLLREHPQVVVRRDLLDAHLYIFDRWVLDFLVANEQISRIKGDLLPRLVRKQFSDKRTDDPSDVYNFLPPSPLAGLDLPGAESPSTRPPRITCFAHVVAAHGLDKAQPNDDAPLVARANTRTTYAELNHALQMTNKYFKMVCPLDGTMPETIHPEAELSGKDTKLGPECRVGAGSKLGKVTVKRSMIGRHCKIADCCKLTNCIVMDYVEIAENVTLTNCVVGNNARIGAFSSLTNCNVGPKYQVEEKVKSKDESFEDDAMAFF